MNKMKILVIVSVVVGFVAVVSGHKCGDSGGECKNIITESCRSDFQRGKCPGSRNIQCCLDSPCKDQGGTCQNSQSSSCSGGQYVSGLCPGPAQVRCCKKSSSGGSRCAREGGVCLNAARDTCDSLFQSGKCSGPRAVQCCKSGTGCGSAAKNLACQINRNSLIVLKNSHFSGVSDGAYASLNIRDTCNGNQAQRSAYSQTCPRGAKSAPGGTTCLHESILQYIIAVANEGRKFTVNSLAGGCHSTNSLHYEGRAVDLSVTSSTPKSVWQKWMELCTDHGGTALGPGSPGHSGHVHCQIK